MTSQIVKRTAAPFRGAVRGMGRDWLAGAALLLLWTALWTVFTAGVLGPAARLAGKPGDRGAVVEVGASPRAAAPAWVAAR